MTQKNKELLLKDIYARIPYGVEGCCEGTTLRTTPSGWYAEYEVGYSINYMIIKSGWRPYLFPLSSMTEEQSKIYHELIRGMFGTSALINFEALEDFFNKNHIDYRGLIPMGLALDATGLNIY